MALQKLVHSVTRFEKGVETCSTGIGNIVKDLDDALLHMQTMKATLNKVSKAVVALIAVVEGGMGGGQTETFEKESECTEDREEKGGICGKTKTNARRTTFFFRRRLLCRRGRT